MMLWHLKAFLAGERLPFLELKVPTQGGPLMCKLTNPEPSLLCEPLNTVFSVIQLCLTFVFATSWMVAHQAPLSMGFSKQGYGSGLPCPPPGDLPDTGMEPVSPTSPALVGRIFTTAPPGRLLGGNMSASITPEPGSWQLGTIPKARILLNISKQASP